MRENENRSGDRWESHPPMIRVWRQVKEKGREKRTPPCGVTWGRLGEALGEPSRRSQLESGVSQKWGCASIPGIPPSLDDSNIWEVPPQHKGGDGFQVGTLVTHTPSNWRLVRLILTSTTPPAWKSQGATEATRITGTKTGGRLLERKAVCHWLLQHCGDILQFWVWQGGWKPCVMPSEKRGESPLQGRMKNPSRGLASLWGPSRAS